MMIFQVMRSFLHSVIAAQMSQPPPSLKLVVDKRGDLHLQVV